MSTLSTTNIKNPSYGSNNLVLDTNGNTRVATTISDSAGANTSTAAEIASGRAKAWVSFTGTGTVTIRGSYNVSSITDGGVGIYTVNLTSAFADANYSCVAISESGQTSSYNFTTGAATISTRGTGGSANDATLVSGAFFR